MTPEVDLRVIAFKTERRGRDIMMVSNSDARIACFGVFFTSVFIIITKFIFFHSNTDSSSLLTRPQKDDRGSSSSTSIPSPTTKKSASSQGNFGFCLTTKSSRVVLRANNIPNQVSSSAVIPAEHGYDKDFWGKVDFPPVPHFFINTHDPVNQDIYISGTVHQGTQPWDPYVWNLFVRILADAGPDNLVVDVGANLGYFSLMAASMGQRVVSFEPMNRNAAKFQSSILRNHFQDRINLHQNAVSYESSGTVTLDATHHTNQGNGKIEEEAVAVGLLKQKEGIYGQDYVETIRLDDVLLLRNNNILLMKIDVEGFESAVLDGAKSLICWNVVRFITIEFSPQTRESKNCNALRMLQLFDAIGYAISDINRADSPRLSPLQLNQYPPNILFRLLDTSTPPGKRLPAPTSSLCQKVPAAFSP